MINRFLDAEPTYRFGDGAFWKKVENHGTFFFEHLVKDKSYQSSTKLCIDKSFQQR